MRRLARKGELQMSFPEVPPASLIFWKEQHRIYTNHNPDGGSKFGPVAQYECWCQFESKVIFLCQTPAGTKDDEVLGYGDTEREAIKDFCKKHDFEAPPWWQ